MPASIPTVRTLISESGRFAFDGAVAAFLYSGPARESVLRLEYSAPPPDMAAALARAAVEAGVRADVIIPMPLHPRRLLSRGYNQAALLTRPLAEAFAVRAGVDLAGMRVGLVDGVLTTGATLDAAASALNRAESGPVTALAFAHEA